MKFFFLLLFPMMAWAQEYPYYTAPEGFEETSGTRKEISPNTPIKAQDGIGVCYGFSATSLLEHYRCKELALNCNDPRERLSSLDVTSYYQKGELEEGGNAFRIFSNLEQMKNPRIALEECAKFSDLVYRINMGNYSYTEEEKNGWNLLAQKWNEYKGIGITRNDCVNCLVESIKKELTNLQTPAEQIREAFVNARDLNDFLYRSILPKKCLSPEETVSIPKFKPNNFPLYNEKLTPESLNKKIQSLLLSDIPVEMGICTQPLEDKTKCAHGSAHSVALFGIKEVCQGRDCRAMVKVKNSYGMSWQRQFDDGWIDLNTLVESSIVLTKFQNISWLERPGFVLKERVLRTVSAKPSSSNSGGLPSQYKDHKGIWKCPGAKYVQNYEEGCVPYKP
ncbi:hypothetical protein ACJVC5_16020 [Peredibacter sp. HCB2-198]|uniref:hypothetical protein n=1 Tax=Peredibacter sp. HCB2-198 TaxID=3383025 RepID=UPI0038B5A685